ncbi:hypothetical protein BT96DRAFT_101771 [Gymnopus androsaceus JB14]|uniref:Uncharacterized protein n=1 Tax=Gymnopus androsaceus JB14 TaxID=1447944 RepID=A0A6A4HFJ5_9AGAR|nr:hypothetical protein BT96DRAFT_101771 [Gymnopus androsaceus JB14]
MSTTKCTSFSSQGWRYLISQTLWIQCPPASRNHHRSILERRRSTAQLPTRAKCERAKINGCIRRGVEEECVQFRQVSSCVLASSNCGEIMTKAAKAAGIRLLSLVPLTTSSLEVPSLTLTQSENKLKNKIVNQRDMKVWSKPRESYQPTR